jgi:hypothetical protein
VVAPAERSGTGITLLGWSTQADFSIELARDHLERSSGPLEVRDANEAITAVLIPAGGWAKITGDNTLFPIWASDTSQQPLLAISASPSLTEK